MQIKTTSRLFNDKYQYKIVLVCPGAHCFRRSVEAAIKQFETVDLSKPLHSGSRNTHIRSQEQLDYAFQLANLLNSMTDIDIRVESPWVSVYSNDRAIVDQLRNLNPDHVKYISLPKSVLSPGTVRMPKMNFDYRITLGKTMQNHQAFVDWALSSSKCRLTKSCVRDLLKTRSWGGTHFYLSGENNLLLVRMHLGGSISKLERIVKN